MQIEKLDRAFSLFIRYRDADKNGYVTCCTCGKRMLVKESHCGHFISRRHLATRMHEQNCAAQCPGCNTFNQGKQFEFSLYLNKKYGPGTADKLLVLSRGLKKFAKFEIDALTDHYKKEAERIKKEKGL